jgi:hypothetical protein
MLMTWLYKKKEDDNKQGDIQELVQLESFISCILNEAPGSNEGTSWGGSIINKVNCPRLYQQRWVAGLPRSRSLPWPEREPLALDKKVPYRPHWRSSLRAEKGPRTILSNMAKKWAQPWIITCSLSRSVDLPSDFSGWGVHVVKVIIAI